MSYEAKEWVNGEIITAEDLNHIEQGIAESGGGAEVMVVNFEAYRATSSVQYEITADKTFDEIEEAYGNGAVIVFRIKEQMGSNPYSVYSGLACARTTFNEHSELVNSMFSAIVLIDAYSNSRGEVGIHSNGNIYFSLYG